VLPKAEFLIEVKMEPNNKYVKSSFWTNLFKSPTAKSETESLLLSLLPFKKLDQKHINMLLKIVHHRTYAPNEFIFHQGDPGIGLYIIQEGEVLISRKSDNGYEHKFVKLGIGDFFGELALLDGEVRSASALSLKESKIIVIFRPDLDEFVEKFPRKGIDILRGISQIITTRLRQVNEDYISLYNKSVEQIQEVQNGSN
jgi:CRP-like cAMP-binding protein